jgi:hypothetical protein
MNMHISQDDLSCFERLVFDESLEPSFEYMKSCLTWGDERPTGLSKDGLEFLYDLWIVRGFIHRSIAEKDWGLDPEYFKHVWEYGLNIVPQWPGFKRLVLTGQERQYLEDSLRQELC